MCSIVHDGALSVEFQRVSVTGGAVCRFGARIIERGPVRTYVET